MSDAEKGGAYFREDTVHNILHAILNPVIIVSSTNVATYSFHLTGLFTVSFTNLQVHSGTHNPLLHLHLSA